MQGTRAWEALCGMKCFQGGCEGNQSQPDSTGAQEHE